MDAEIVKELRDNVRPAVEQLIGLLTERGLSMLEVRQDGMDIRIERQAGTVVAEEPASAPVPALDEHHRMVPVLSTLVGVFRTRPATDKPQATVVGTEVEVGRVLGFVESMGLTYEVHAPAAGRLAEILVEEGHPVEFGQPLVVLEAHA